MNAVENPFLPPRKPWERDYTDEQRQEMKRRKNAGELLPGNKLKKDPNERELDNLTKVDYAVLAFIGEHKQATSSIMAVWRGVNRETMSNRLKALFLLGLLGHHVIGGKSSFVWYLTPAGKRLVIEKGYALAYQLSTDRTKRKLQADKHALAVSMTAAHLIAGTNGREPVDPRLVIGETAMKSKWQTALGGFNRQETFGKGGVGQDLKIKMFNEIRNRQIKFDEVLDAEPALWTVTGPLTNPNVENYHLPDLVVNLEAGRGAAPQSIAYEIELTEKDEERYAQTLNLYMQDTFVYSKVIWVIDDEKTLQMIIRAAKKIRFPKDRLKFEWLRDPAGKRIDGLTYNF